MSRNIRQRAPVTPVKKSKRRVTKLPSTSSDSDYEGVNDISDSEEDEPDVERADTEALINSYSGEEDDELQSRPDNYDNDSVDWEGFDDTPQPLDLEPSFFEDHMSRMNQPDYDTTAATYDAINGAGSSESETTPIPRRVRFNLESDDESDIGDFDTNILFLDQDSLRPEFRREIEQDNDGNVSSDGGQYEWSSDENDGFAAAAANFENDSSSGYDSSGYDSEDDDGDTTDEDIPENAVAPARSVLRRPSIESQASDTSTEEIPVTRRSKISTPRMGTWKQDRSIPFVMFDNTGKKLLRFHATAVSRRTSFASVSTPLKTSPIETPLELSPMLSNSANLMMSGMASIDQLGGGPPIGPIEAFYPFTYVSPNGNMVQDSPSSNEMDDDDFFDFGEDTQEWDMNELIDLSAVESHTEDDQDPSPSSDALELASTPARPSSALSRSEEQAHPLLTHFHNPAVVGAFRNNQRRHQLLTRDNQTQESLAFAGPLGQGSVRGFKGGRIAAANKPLTPRRKTIQNPIASSPSPGGSPLAAQVQTQMAKRKFAGERFGGYGLGHKRHRSAF